MASTLVFTAFSGEQIPNGMTVDHINRIRHDNRICNLRLATPIEQMANSESRVGREKPTMHRRIAACKNGEIIFFSRMSVLVTGMVAPGVLHATAVRKIYDAIRSGTAAYGYTYSYESLMDKRELKWSPIPPDSVRGATGYKASDTGLIKTPRGVVTAGTLGRFKEYRVINIQQHEYRVHRLVADAHSKCDAKRVLVNHIDGDKLNNCISNLERVTASENSRHAVATGLSVTPPGRAVRRSSISGTSSEETVLFESVNSAARSVGKTHHNIIACCSGRQKTAYGFMWSYVE